MLTYEPDGHLKERLKEFIAYKGLTEREFCRRLGVGSAYIQSIKKSISTSKAEKLSQLFPELNIIWLISGNGEMLYKMKVVKDENDGSLTTEEGKFYTYLLPVAAIGGELSGFDCEGVLPRDCERVISPVADVDFAMPVIGDSMEPEYPSGSRLMVKRIFPDDFISWGNVFVLDTTNGPLIKEVQPSDLGENYIKCVSHNPSGRYKPFDVPRSSIRAMYRVVACVSLK